MAFSEHCWKSHIMDYWLWIIDIPELESDCCAQHALYYIHLKDIHIHYTVWLKFKFNVSKSARLRPLFLSSQEFDLTQRWFFKITSSNSARRSVLLRKTQVSETLFRRSEDGASSYSSWWTKYCLSKRNCRWCYLSRAAATLDPDKQSADSFAIMTAILYGDLLTKMCFWGL